MKLRVIERFDLQGNPFYVIQRQYFWFFWEDKSRIEYASVDNAIEQAKNYLKQYNRNKNPRVFYSCEDLNFYVA